MKKKNGNKTRNPLILDSTYLNEKCMQKRQRNSLEQVFKEVLPSHTSSNGENRRLDKGT